MTTKPITIPGFLIKDRGWERINITENIDLEVENIARSMANKQLNQFSNIYFNKIKKNSIFMNYKDYLLIVPGEPNSIFLKFF